MFFCRRASKQEVKQGSVESRVRARVLGGAEVGAGGLKEQRKQTTHAVLLGECRVGRRGCERARDRARACSEQRGQHPEGKKGRRSESGTRFALLRPKFRSSQSMGRRIVPSLLPTSHLLQQSSCRPSHRPHPHRPDASSSSRPLSLVCPSLLRAAPSRRPCWRPPPPPRHD